ncbi:Na(+)/H(+) antiporter subunit G1 [Novipirellula aureliae]|uniref:Na(+)/H(+) antiporter subunit G1 n=1 Tax=Novipirellula aureliae TaxID=2527966 RepID=A0A5C6DKC9_9BACT|nr:monovalent cation/H(+) antiporter subunit G [Novipirellula aureliae]TWU37813.1 Na(+)/H(+) antiporter subunit G1 [Novipirellula aureliae]
MSLWDIFSWVLLITGSIFSMIGGIGIVRLPEFYSRMHGAGITDTMGAGLIVAGLMCQSGLSLTTLKLVAILFFLLITSPSSCHALARSAMEHSFMPGVDLDSSRRAGRSGSGRSESGGPAIAEQKDAIKSASQEKGTESA